ncbi:MAG TPA: hypothetical protein VHS81_10335 [Caulobacteraceae bacterium]|jgi:hypothetical protein|nr:hypothetical protein [Caulobacteraceae bacterium]
MITEADLVPSSNAFDPDAMLAVAEMVGMAAPTDDEMPVARELAATLMAQEVVSVANLRAVQAIQPAATLVYRQDGKVVGVAGQLLLRPCAVRQLFDGVFDAMNVDTDCLSRPGEMPALGYCWGVAASTKPAAGAVIGFSKRVRELLFADLTIFTRAVTPVGRHTALNRHGYVPLRRPDDDLLIRLPERQAVAA